MLSLHEAVTISGGILNIIGGIIIYIFGLSPKLKKGYMAQMSEEKYKRNKRLTNLGLALVGVGLLLQFWFDITACFHW